MYFGSIIRCYCRIIETDSMNFLEFKDRMFDLACFNIYQVFASFCDRFNFCVSTKLLLRAD